jgi:alkylation response protein AidB-like acyl-CoA dehydrogenase
MPNFFTDNDDLQFYIERGIDWAPLLEVTEYGFRAPDALKTTEEARGFYREVAASMGELAATSLAPRAATIDREDSHLRDGEVVPSAAFAAVFDEIAAAEMHKLCLPRELGGLNAPLLVYFLGAEMIARGDVSAMTHFSFHGGMAMAMLVYSINEGTTELDLSAGRIVSTRFAEEMAEIASGKAWGCMDITEPNAGSDMAAIRTRGEQDADGNWWVTGQKIFITSGHGKYHFVIARTEPATSSDDPLAGLAGLSMFLVKTYDDLPDGKRVRHVTLERVEDKLGHHGSVTAALSFERAPAQLIGKRGEGFKYMLTLMNNARVGVGFESIGLCEAAYRMASSYAEQRVSMGKPIARHEMIADMLDEMRVDVRALRALGVASAYHEEMAQKLALLDRFSAGASEIERKRIKRELPRHRAASRRLTPLLKYLASEKAVELARRNLQIHGGVGYTREYGAEKLLRDALVLPIYEGTSQIQSLMAMKDTLGGIIKNPQAFLTKMASASYRSVSARDPLERRVAHISSISAAAQRHLVTKTAAGKLKTLSSTPASTWRRALTENWDPKRDFALAMLHAERLTRILADEAISEILLEQATRFPERRDLLERWLDRAELRCESLLREITARGERALARLGGGPAVATPAAAE